MARLFKLAFIPHITKTRLVSLANVKFKGKFEKTGQNIRDFASINELVVLSNLENINSVLIRNQIEKEERFRQLREIATIQLKSIDQQDFMKTLKKASDDVYIKHSAKKILKKTQTM